MRISPPKVVFLRVLLGESADVFHTEQHFRRDDGQEPFADPAPYIRGLYAKNSLHLRGPQVVRQLRRRERIARGRGRSAFGDGLNFAAGHAIRFPFLSP